MSVGQALADSDDVVKCLDDIDNRLSGVSLGWGDVESEGAIEALVQTLKQVIVKFGGAVSYSGDAAEGMLQEMVTFFQAVSQGGKRLEFLCSGPGLVAVQDGLVMPDVQTPSQALADGESKTVAVVAGELVYMDGPETLSRDFFLENGVDVMDVTAVKFSSETVEIEDGTFKGTPLSRVFWPLVPKVQRVGQEAFASSRLTTIALPSSVSYVGERAFWGCCLTGVAMPISIAYVGEDAFGLQAGTAIKLKLIDGHGEVQTANAVNALVNGVGLGQRRDAFPWLLGAVQIGEDPALPETQDETAGIGNLSSVFEDLVSAQMESSPMPGSSRMFSTGKVTSSAGDFVLGSVFTVDSGGRPPTVFPEKYAEDDVFVDITECDCGASSSCMTPDDDYQVSCDMCHSYSYSKHPFATSGKTCSVTGVKAVGSVSVEAKFQTGLDGDGNPEYCTFSGKTAADVLQNAKAAGFFLAKSGTWFKDDFQVSPPKVTAKAKVKMRPFKVIQTYNIVDDEVEYSCNDCNAHVKATVSHNDTVDEIIQGKDIDADFDVDLAEKGASTKLREKVQSSMAKAVVDFTQKNPNENELAYGWSEPEVSQSSESSNDGKGCIPSKVMDFYRDLKAKAGTRPSG